ncbi:hypothetical protein GCM10027589_14030 [Actinocorallia lasiicapitis]
MDPAFLSIVRRHLRFLPADQDLAADSPLREYGLDSMAAVALIVELEDEFSAVIPDSRLVDAFTTPGRLWDALRPS